jgi:dihydroorotate dehydrogenase
MEFFIIGVGGASSVEDFHSYQKKGADAVMSATASMWNPYLAQEIKENYL